MKKLSVMSIQDMNTIVRRDCGLDFVRPDIDVTGPKFIGTDNYIHKRC